MCIKVVTRYRERWWTYIKIRKIINNENWKKYYKSTIHQHNQFCLKLNPVRRDQKHTSCRILRRRNNCFLNCSTSWIIAFLNDLSYNMRSSEELCVSRWCWWYDEDDDNGWWFKCRWCCWYLRCNDELAVLLPLPPGLLLLDDAVELRDEDVVLWRRRVLNGDLVLSESLSLLRVQCCCMRERFNKRVARAGKWALKRNKVKITKNQYCSKMECLSRQIQ